MKICSPESGAERCNSSPITTGRDGCENICPLQRRPKWVKSRGNAWIGDLVLLAEDEVVHNRWPMGRVVELYTGEDGGVKSARVKTAGSVFHRPVTKICLLENANDDE